ncbi:hydroxymethylbilane synthase [Amnibacterium flavum]|uniref:Porphobilinogen deaminase n=1 Tax=Amnibacterium flavum TaxID=2173173 RepID=A0A2V1HSF5_9MICO|nr:hydroxymethylbilane synthase [Amnibacterium flavum]PVZ95523.1 hydroxymethylbilane synthase [Amnibacterium flavum]
MTIRIGTRASALALAQTGHVADALTAASGADIEIVTITSEGDVNSSSLSRIGGTGVFAGALRDALIAGRCDIIVHSLKDLPTVPFEGLVLAAVPPRADARDALCARDGATLATLPAAARVGTGSPRRRAQLLAQRPDLDVVDIRGNVDTRLSRVRQGDLDAVVLSYAGLERLGRLDEATDVLDLVDWPTAPGQGALAIEVRAADAAHLWAPYPEATVVGAAVSALSDPVSSYAVTAERAVLRGLEAGCTAPVAAAATVGDGRISLNAVVFSADGTKSISRGADAAYDSTDLSTLQVAADRLGREVALALLDAGAAELAPMGAGA